MYGSGFTDSRCFEKFRFFKLLLGPMAHLELDKEEESVSQVMKNRTKLRQS